jgi:hypothetical protein
MSGSTARQEQFPIIRGYGSSGILSSGGTHHGVLDGFAHARVGELQGQNGGDGSRSEVPGKPLVENRVMQRRHRTGEVRLRQPKVAVAYSFRFGLVISRDQRRSVEPVNPVANRILW